MNCKLLLNVAHASRRRLFSRRQRRPLFLVTRLLYHVFYSVSFNDGFNGETTALPFISLFCLLGRRGGKVGRGVSVCKLVITVMITCAAIYMRLIMQDRWQFLIGDGAAHLHI